MAEKLSVKQVFSDARNIASRNGTVETFIATMHAKYPQFAHEKMEKNPDKSRRDVIQSYWRGELTRVRNIFTARLKDARERKNTEAIEANKLGLSQLKFERKVSEKKINRMAESVGLEDMMKEEHKAKLAREEAEREEAEREEAEMLAELAASAGQLANGKVE